VGPDVAAYEDSTQRVRFCTYPPVSEVGPDVAAYEDSTQRVRFCTYPPRQRWVRDVAAYNRALTPIWFDSRVRVTPVRTTGCAHVGCNIKDPPLTRWICEIRYEETREPPGLLVGFNISDPPLTRWVCAKNLTRTAKNSFPLTIYRKESYHPLL
jgi:hypothetical protein